MFYQTNPTTFWIISIVMLGCITAIILSGFNTSYIAKQIEENEKNSEKTKLQVVQNSKTIDESKIIIRTQDFGIQTKDLNNTYDWSFTSGCKDGTKLVGTKQEPFDSSSFFCIKVISTDKDGTKINKNILCMDPLRPGDFTNTITCPNPPPVK